MTNAGKGRERAVRTLPAPRSLEELRHELVQVVAPVDPGMPSGAFLEHRREAVLLEQIDGRLRGRDQSVVLARGEPQHLDTLLQGGVVEHLCVRRFPLRGALCGGGCGRGGRWGGRGLGAGGRGGGGGRGGAPYRPPRPAPEKKQGGR